LNASTTREGLAWINGRRRKVGVISWKSLGEGRTRQNVGPSIILNLPSIAGTEVRRWDHVLCRQLLDALATDLAGLGKQRVLIEFLSASDEPGVFRGGAADDRNLILGCGITGA